MYNLRICHTDNRSQSTYSLPLNVGENNKLHASTCWCYAYIVCRQTVSQEQLSPAISVLIYMAVPSPLTFSKVISNKIPNLLATKPVAKSFSRTLPRVETVKPAKPRIATFLVLFSALVLNDLSQATTFKLDTREPYVTWEYLNPSGCPTEHYRGIRVSRKNTEAAGHRGHLYVAGDEILLECIDSASFVYPRTTRTCQPDGTWSGAPPLCTRFNTSDVLKVAAQSTPKCPTSGCTVRGGWTAVGVLHGPCFTGKANKSLNGEQRQVLFNFSQPVHFSFVTIALPEGGQSREMFNVRVKAPRHDVINLLSTDSQALLQGHYGIHSRNQRLEKIFSPSECAVTQIGAYTSQILIEYSPKLESPPTEFFAIVDGNLGRDSPDCAQPPTIPNANLTVTKDGRTAEVVCHSDYEILNPVDKKDSSGVLQCTPESGWHPYPFPVCCRPVKIVGSQPVGQQKDYHVSTTRTVTSQAAKTYKKDKNELPSSIFAKADHFGSVTISSISSITFHQPRPSGYSEENKSAKSLDRKEERRRPLSTSVFSHHLSIAAFVLIALGSISFFIIAYFFIKDLRAASIFRSTSNNNVLPQLITVHSTVRGTPEHFFPLTRNSSCIPEGECIVSSTNPETEPMYNSASEEDYDDVIIYDEPLPLSSCYSLSKLDRLSHKCPVSADRGHSTAPTCHQPRFLFNQTIMPPPADTLAKVNVIATKKLRSNTL